MKILEVIKKGLKLASDKDITDPIGKCVFAVNYLHDEIIPDESVNSEYQNEAASDDLLFSAYEETSIQKKRKLAYQSFKLDRYNYDALLVILRLIEKEETVLFLLEILIKDAKWHLEEKGFFIKDTIGSFWGFIETRPYMRLKYDYILALIKVDKIKEAIKESQECLILNENDNLGIRYIYANLLVRVKEYHKVLKLVDHYNDGSINMLIPVAIANYYLGHKIETSKIIDRIISYSDEFISIIFDFNYLDEDVISQYDQMKYHELDSIEEVYHAVKVNETIIFESIEFFQWLKDNFYDDEKNRKIDLNDLSQIYLNYFFESEKIYFFDYKKYLFFSLNVNKLFRIDYLTHFSEEDQEINQKLKESIIVDFINKETINEMFIEELDDLIIKSKFISRRSGKILIKQFDKNLQSYNMSEVYEEFMKEKSFKFAKEWCHYNRISY